MLKDNMLAYAEVDEILNLLEKEYRERVPEKIRNFFKEEKMPDYNPKIEIGKQLTEQNLKRETMVLLAILNINYWCDSEEEKQMFIDEMAKNEEEKRELAEKYNPDKLFKNRKNNNLSSDNADETQSISLEKKKKQGIFKRILEKITKFFKRN